MQVNVKDLTKFIKKSQIKVMGNAVKSCSVEDIVLRSRNGKLAIESAATGLFVLTQSNIPFDIDQFLPLGETAAFLKALPKSGEVNLSVVEEDNAPWISIKGRGTVNRTLCTIGVSVSYGTFVAFLDEEGKDLTDENLKDVLEFIWGQTAEFPYRVTLEEDIRKELKDVINDIKAVYIGCDGDTFYIRGGSPHYGDMTTFKYEIAPFGEVFDKPINPDTFKAVISKLDAGTCDLLFTGGDNPNDESGVCIYQTNESGEVYYAISRMED